MQANDYIDMLNRAITYHLQEVNICLPAEIVSYDATTLKASIQILVKRHLDKDNVEQYPVFTNVPVQFPNGGDFQISFPLKAGDKGRIVVFQSSIDSYITGDGGVSTPKDQRMFSLNDIAFIPGIAPYKKVIPADPNNLIIQNKNKTSTVSLTTDGKINMVANADLTIKANTKIEGNVDIQGTLTVSGDATISGKSFLGHIHGGVMSGGSNTSPPV